MHVPRSLSRRSVGDSLFDVTNLTDQELFRPSHFCVRRNDKLRVLSNESASSSSQCLLRQELRIFLPLPLACGEANDRHPMDLG